MGRSYKYLIQVVYCLWDWRSSPPGLGRIWERPSPKSSVTPLAMALPCQASFCRLCGARLSQGSHRSLCTAQMQCVLCSSLCPSSSFSLTLCGQLLQLTYYVDQKQPTGSMQFRNGLGLLWSPLVLPCPAAQLCFYYLDQALHTPCDVTQSCVSKPDIPGSPPWNWPLLGIDLWGGRNSGATFPLQVFFSLVLVWWLCFLHVNSGCIWLLLSHEKEIYFYFSYIYLIFPPPLINNPSLPIDWRCHFCVCQ